jgi:hypothetical protein
MSINHLSPDNDNIPEWEDASENTCPACEKDKQGIYTTLSDHVTDPNGCLYIDQVVEYFFKNLFKNLIRVPDKKIDSKFK